MGETQFFKNYVFKEGKNQESKPSYLLKRGSVIFVENSVIKKEVINKIDQYNEGE